MVPDLKLCRPRVYRALRRVPAESALEGAVEAAYADTDPALAAGDYVAVLGRLARLRPQVDAFFDQVMVNVDDAAVRNNRLALLRRLADRLGSGELGRGACRERVCPSV